MEVCHTTPCAECPWRKDSAQGYLGGHTTEVYADAVSEGVNPACHMSDFGPEDDRTAFCAGAASVMANACKMPTEAEPGQQGARYMRDVVGKSDDTFKHPALFFQYHEGKPYVPRIMRMLA